MPPSSSFGELVHRTRECSRLQCVDQYFHSDNAKRGQDAAFYIGGILVVGIHPLWKKESHYPYEQQAKRHTN